MRQHHKNVRLTKLEKTQENVKENTHECYFTIVPITTTVKTFLDQTGRFPVTSRKGNKYVIIFCAYDANTILGEAIKLRTEAEILRAFTKMHDYLAENGLKPKYHQLDNKCPATLKTYTKKEKIEYQLVPSHIHRRNSAGNEIGTFKDYFIVGLVGVDPKMPLHLWCRLLPQALLTLNLMRQSRLQLKLSAYAQMEGQHDYNAHTLAPQGIQVLIN